MEKQKYKITYKIGDDIKDVIVEAKCIEKILDNVSLTKQSSPWRKSTEPSD